MLCSLGLKAERKQGKSVATKKTFTRESQNTPNRILYSSLMTLSKHSSFFLFSLLIKPIEKEEHGKCKWFMFIYKCAKTWSSGSRGRYQDTVRALLRYPWAPDAHIGDSIRGVPCLCSHAVAWGSSTFPVTLKQKKQSGLRGMLILSDNTQVYNVG